jgi:hypothetical protein
MYFAFYEMSVRSAHAVRSMVSKFLAWAKDSYTGGRLTGQKSARAGPQSSRNIPVNLAQAEKLYRHSEQYALTTDTR